MQLQKVFIPTQDLDLFSAHPELKDYFRKNKALLRVSSIEKMAQLSPKTLQHFLDGRRLLSDSAAKKVWGVVALLQVSQQLTN